MKALDFNCLKAHTFQAIGFKYRPAPPLHDGIRDGAVDVVTERCANAAAAGVAEGEAVERGETRLSVVFVRKGAR